MAAERFQEGSNPSFKISFGEWPGPEPVFGDIHVDLGSGNSPQHREKFSDLADLHGGSVRNAGDKLWADFSTQHDAKNFVRDSKVFLQMVLPDKEFEEVNTLVSEYGLKFQPLPLRNPVVSLVKETGEEKRFSYAAVGKNNNMALFESLVDSYDFKNWTELYELPLDKQREVVSGVRDFLNNPSNGLSVCVDTVKFPEWALGSLMNGDYSALSDEEISQIEKFQDAYKGSVFVPREEAPSFERTPVIGQAADSVSLDIINITSLSELRMQKQMADFPTLYELRMQKQMADFRDVTNIELDVKDGHPYYDGNLDLHQIEIKALPDNLVVDGFLDLHKTSINSLPLNLVVNGDLDLMETNIESIPEDLKVKGKLALPARRMGSKVSELYDISPDYLGREYKRRDGYLDICRIKREWNDLTSNDFKTNHFGLFFPLMQQYADFKRNYPNVVPLFNIGDGYETYQADAERVGKALRLPVQESVSRLGPDDKPAKVITIPPQGYWISQLKVNRIPFAVLEDASRLKSVDSSEGSDLSNGLGREQSQEQADEQHRGSGIRR